MNQKSNKRKKLTALDRMSLFFGTKGLVFALAVLAAIAGLVVFVNSQKSPEISELEPEIRDDFSIMLKTGTLETLANKAKELGSGYNKLETPGQIESIKKLLRIADNIQDRKVEAGPFLELDKSIRLQALKKWDRISRRNALATTELEGQDFRSYAQEIINDGETSKTLQREARVSLALSYCESYTSKKNESDIVQLGDQLIGLVKNYPEDNMVLRQSFEITKLVCLAGQTAEAQNKDLALRVAESYLENPSENVKVLGRTLHELVLVGKRSFKDAILNLQIGTDEPTSQIRFLIEQSSKSNQLGKAYFSNCLKAIESLSQNKNDKEADALLSIVESSLQNQADSVKEFGFNKIDRLQQRRQLLGQTIELQATKEDGASVDFSDCDGHPVVMLFLSVNQSTLEALEYLKFVDSAHEDGVRFVGVLVGSPNTKSLPREELLKFLHNANVLFEAIERRFPYFKFVEVSANTEIMAQCPVDTPPYLIVLNEDRVVTNNNVLMSDIRTIVEQLVR